MSKKYNMSNVEKDKGVGGHACNCRSHEFVFGAAAIYDRKYSTENIRGGKGASYLGWTHDDMKKVCKSVYDGPRIGHVVRLHYSTPTLGLGTKLFLNKNLHTKSDNLMMGSTEHSWIFSESSSKFFRIDGRTVVEIVDSCMPEPCKCEEGTLKPHEFFFKSLWRKHFMYKGWFSRDLPGLCERIENGEKIGSPETLHYSTPELGIGTVLFSDDMSMDDGTLTTTGTVRYNDIEGGFWGVMTPNAGGLLGDLDPKWQEEGKEVLITYKIPEQQPSIYMWGTQIDILDISDVSESPMTKFKIKRDSQWIWSEINQVFYRLENRVIVEMRECEEAPVGCYCPEIYDPICGEDGNTYSSECHATCKGIDKEYKGECEKPVTDCICTKEYRPVCGTDGKTYSNKCMAECKGVGIADNQPCDKEPVGDIEILETTNTPKLKKLEFRWTSVDSGAKILQAKNLMKPKHETFKNRDMSEWSTVYTYKHSEKLYDLHHPAWPDAAVSDAYIEKYGDKASRINSRGGNSEQYVTFADDSSDVEITVMPTYGGKANPYEKPISRSRNQGYKQLYLNGKDALFIYAGDNANPSNSAHLGDELWPVVRKV